MFRSKDSHGKPKYVGTSRAVVIENRDPLNRGRIQVDHAILGETSWIPYLNSPGMFSVPSIKDVVFITCESGEAEHSYAWGNITKGDKAKPDLPDRFKRTVPTNRGLYTPGGNFIELDDGEAKPGADPKASNLSTKKRGIRISRNGYEISINDDPDNGVENITIVDKAGDGIVFNSKDKKVNVISKGTLSISADDSLDIKSNKNIQISSENDLTAVNAKTILLESSTATEIHASTQVKVSGDSGSEFGSAGSVTEVKGQQVKLAGGGVGVARLGDRAFGIGNMGAPVSSTIIQGSTKVFSG